MKMNALLRKIQVLLVCILVTSLLSAPVMVQARTVEEINAEIQKSQAELALLKKKLEQAGSDVTSTQAKKNSSTSEIAKVKEQLTLVQQTYELNLLQQKQLENEITIKNLEKEEQQKLMDDQVVNTYINWKTEDFTNTVFGKGGDLIKNVLYFEFLSKQTEEGINNLGAKIEGLSTQSNQFQQQVSVLANDLNALNQQKVLLENQIKQYDQSLATASKNMNDMKNRSAQVINDQNNLFAELEKEVTNNLSGTSALVSGQVYFYGTVGHPTNNKNDQPYCSYGIDPSTDAFGHGIGMSQFGAYGAANAGWNASRILSFYYQGATVASLNRSNSVSVTHGGQTLNMSMDDYVSGLGEVPNLACGTTQQITDWNNFANQQGWAANDPKRNKYVIDNPNSIYDCWPEESIKAQVIIARSYAATSNMPICDSASCQVYNGGLGKAWAAYETSGQYLTYNGSPIRAYYSAFNSNSKGTADIDTVWSDWRGNGSTQPYFKSVNDSAFAYVPALCNLKITWATWRSNSYTIAELDSMLSWCAQQGHCDSWSKIKQIKDQIGTLKSVSLTRDASGRVKKINFAGTLSTQSISGWYLRQVFNTWGSAVKPKGLDKLQSVTFNIAVAQ